MVARSHRSHRNLWKPRLTRHSACATYFLGCATYELPPLRRRQARLPVPERVLSSKVPDPTANAGLSAELAQAMGGRATR